MKRFRVCCVMWLIRSLVPAKMDTMEPRTSKYNLPKAQDSHLNLDFHKGAESRESNTKRVKQIAGARNTNALAWIPVYSLWSLHHLGLLSLPEWTLILRMGWQWPWASIGEYDDWRHSNTSRLMSPVQHPWSRFYRVYCFLYVRWFWGQGEVDTDLRLRFRSIFGIFTSQVYTYTTRYTSDRRTYKILVSSTAMRSLCICWSIMLRLELYGMSLL